ncbi:MAG: phenylacetic acid degradation bifunctional protein PaaZ [Planktomarina sp.]|nr:phenylacetic acid degradation bifunctional protein PaaZ [Planktomarina sp.]MDS9950782.1 phenylacetic acid degradation bifunctional protein PaaZ [Planktomarina sp.]|tara:strand:+ start:10030 stop:12069 length:2040 start_codon:yes stop_codon:yes gene_type:complete
MFDINNFSSFALGEWVAPQGANRDVHSAITGKVLGAVGGTLDVEAMRDYAKTHGGPALRALNFHDRARMIKALALYLRDHRRALYELSFETGATIADSKIDIDGGIGTMLVYASKGRREMPEGHIFPDGDLEVLSRDGSFLGQHICTPLRGVAVQINAFNFPVWGMLEKLAPSLLAGMPSLIKPATSTGFLAQAVVRLMLQSGLLPDGAVQLIMGRTGPLLDVLDCQDVVGFTGSAATALSLRSTPNILKNSVRFTAEQDSLNGSLLGPDVMPGSPEFDLFVTEVHREMITKAGQKCTAIRRIMVPKPHLLAVQTALTERLAVTQIGHPALKETQMGPLSSTRQRQDVLAQSRLISDSADLVFGSFEVPDVTGADAQKGAFISPMLFSCADPDVAQSVHSIEAFGPVATLMPFADIDHGIELLNRGGGSLVASVITHDPDVARKVVLGSGALHGRLYFNDRTSQAESTGHGSPLPHMVHGGPGRAGGSEELGGIRGVKHFMQRTAIQGSPDMLSAVLGTWVKGAAQHTAESHPFTRDFHTLRIGETINTAPREITIDDIEHFAKFTGDNFYAHMDEDAAKANPFFSGRVAHGYLLLSFAAGLFVDPNPGPVLANTGLNALSFQKPVEAGDSINVQLTVKRKTRRTDEYGEVRWHAIVRNQEAEQVAEYELLTMNSYSEI